MLYKPARGIDCGQEQCHSIAATTSLCEQADRWVRGRGRWEHLLLCCARCEYVHGGRAVGGRAVPKVRSLVLGTAARQRAVGPGPLRTFRVSTCSSPDLLGVVIHLLPRKVGRCDVAPLRPAGSLCSRRDCEGSCHSHGIVLLAAREGLARRTFAAHGVFGADERDALARAWDRLQEIPRG